MVRKYKRKTNRRTEAERGLGVAVTPRREPDLELLARIIVNMAVTDPLGLGRVEGQTPIPRLDQATPHQ